MKIRAVGAELLHADVWEDGGTDGNDEAIRNFMKAPEYAF
jgi:hypothetical protein